MQAWQYFLPQGLLRRISDTEVEHEAEAQLDGVPLTLHFHPRCYDAWKAECDWTDENTSGPAAA